MKNKELILKDIKKTIESSSHVLIASHKDPEVDCIASAIVISLICDSLGKNYTLYNQDIVPYNFVYF